MSKKPLLIINIGYHKTATTWWQHKIFPQLNSINYIGRKYNGDPYKPKKINWLNKRKFEENNTINLWLNSLSQIGNNEGGINEDVKFLEKFIDEHKPNLLSSENILRPYSVDDTILKLSKLKSHFEVRIVVFIRKQAEIIKSRYLHDVQVKYHSKFTYTINDSLSDEDELACKWPFCNSIYSCTCDPVNKKIITPKFYNYYNLYSGLINYFEHDELFYFPMEALKNNNQKTIEQLLNFCGVSKVDTKVLKLLNEKPIGKRDQSFKKLFEENQSDELKVFETFCDNYYADSNRKISEVFNLDLDQYNY